MIAVPPPECKVYTSPQVAEAIARALGDSPEARWLEPSVGEGVFLSALWNMGVESHRIVALDLDQAAGACDHLALTRRGVDFLQWSQGTRGKFSRVVGNPPYARLSTLAGILRDNALAVRTSTGERITSKANYWYVFLHACLKVLEPGGGIGLVLPASWDYADYGRELRDRLPAMFRRFEVHRSKQPLFDVGDSAVVIVASGFLEAHTQYLRAVHDSPHTLIQALNNGLRDASSPREEPTVHRDDSRMFSEVADVQIGAVTGDADYFLLTDSQRQERKLPTESCVPVLTRARHLLTGELAADDWHRLLRAGERVWLFSPSEEVAQDKDVRRYLALAPHEGGCRRGSYKVRIRKPWYRVGFPAQPDAFMTGMSMLGPWMCVNALPVVTASNTLYVVRFRERCSQETKFAWGLSILTTQAQEQISRCARLYADGLAKYEPGDLGRILLPIPRRTEGARDCYLRAVGVLLGGRRAEAQQLADAWFSQEERES